MSLKELRAYLVKNLGYTEEEVATMRSKEMRELVRNDQEDQEA